MHVIVYKQSTGGVTISHPSPQVLALLMGEGMSFRPDEIVRQIENFLIPSSNEHFRPYTREFVTEWVNAVSSGGLTESQAYDLLIRRKQMRRGFTESATIDEAVLPYHTRGCAEHSEENFDVCEHADCQNRYFRDAVVWDDTEPSKCRCDMPTARGVHMDKIRVVRNKELVANDITFMRAVEDGDTDAQAIIKTKKQELRDIPQTFDLTTDNDTPEELKAKWPEGLPKE